MDRHTVTGLVPGDVITVQTDKGTFRAYKVIVTAGAWTNQILESTGLKLPLKVKYDSRGCKCFLGMNISLICFYEKILVS